MEHQNPLAIFWYYIFASFLLLLFLTWRFSSRRTNTEQVNDSPQMWILWHNPISWASLWSGHSRKIFHTSHFFFLLILDKDCLSVCRNHSKSKIVQNSSSMKEITSFFAIQVESRSVYYCYIRVCFQESQFLICWREYRCQKGRSAAGAGKCPAHIQSRC